MEHCRIIEQQMLENGIQLILFDKSKLTAGDRWLVELRCEAHIPLKEGFWEMVSDEDPEIQAEIRKILGDHLVFESIKQRNFIDDREREDVLQEMVRRVHSSMLEYMKRPHFPQEFFKKQYRETRKKLLLRQAMGLPKQDSRS